MLQPSKKINLREERDFGEKLNATFRFIRLNFKSLFKSLLLYAVPVALLSGIFSGLHQARLFRNLSGDNGYDSFGDYTIGQQITSVNYLVSAFLSVVSVLIVYLVVYAYMVAYQDEEGEVQPSAVWDHLKNNLLKVIYSGFALGIVTFLSFFLLGFGIYLGVVLSFFIMVMVREELSMIDTIERCFYLIKRNWWATFGLLIIVGFIQGVISWISALPWGLVMILNATQVLNQGNSFMMIISSTLATLVINLSYTISAVALGFQYYNLVEQKDGIGLMEQADLIGRHDLSSTNEGDY
ncbi:hypothetical protein [Pontibacter rugosus]|uniref:Glycerophosphoryl diester phosphodiesterase membrane domain-containing protein n=1 Tax=Pontibacter rugosus TaxID=1745966 RepID=A0ABW3SPL1_9BACT